MSPFGPGGPWDPGSSWDPMSPFGPGGPWDPGSLGVLCLCFLGVLYGTFSKKLAVLRAYPYPFFNRT